MKNLKSLFEKEDANIWKETAVWEPRGKRHKKFPKGSIGHRMRSDKRNHKFRMTWE